jgi:hypothetical protein
MTTRLTTVIPVVPLRNDAVTIAGGRLPACPVCGRTFAPVGRRRFCSAACRQAAFRQRHPTSTTGQVPARPPPVRTPKQTTIYECPACGVRLLGEQRCVECGVFCRRIGPGGSCPHCDEPVALADLVPTNTSDRR